MDVRTLSFGEFCAYCAKNMPEGFDIEIKFSDGVFVFENDPIEYQPIIHVIPESGNLHQDVAAAWALIQKIVNEEE